MPQSAEKKLRAEIISVGTELLLGDILNTNARYLSQELASYGFDVYYQTTVGDNAARLRQAIRIAMARSEWIFLTGGLGPTKDDLTKETVAELLSLPMVEDAAVWQNISDYFVRSGRSISDNNRKQALVPKGATVLENHNGTAPGLLLESEGKSIVLLPGPPAEMKPMFEESVVPLLSDLTGRTILSSYLEVCGIGESRLEEMVADLVEKENPSVALYAKTGRVEIRITASSEDKKEAARQIALIEDDLKNRLGKYLYSTEGESPEEALVTLLKEKGLTLTAAESCTGGLIAKKITDVPGASAVLEESFVTYSNRAKQTILGVSPWVLAANGAVSEETAMEMAKGALTRSGADIALAVTGIAGPDGGSEEKPVGLVYLSVADKSGVYVRRFLAGKNKDRKAVRELASVNAISMVRDLILDPASLVAENKTGQIAYAPVAHPVVTEQKEVLQRQPEEPKGKKPFGRRMLEYFIPLKKDRPMEWVRKIALLVAIPTFIISGCVLLHSYLQSVEAKQLLSELRDTYDPLAVVTPEQREEAQYPADYQDSFFALYQINRDVKGYIRIPGTKVDFPFVQGKDNDYYLRRSFKGQKNDYGVCFVDYRCDVKSPSDNLILYAHNMKDDEMFANLLKYKKVSYFQQHPLVEMDTVYRNGKYVIFAAFLANADEKDGPVFGYHNMVNFESEAQFNRFIAQVERRSWIDTGIDVRYGDEIITLSTCSYDVASGRFVVMARRLRPGESETVNISLATQKTESDILYPYAYYKKHGLKLPPEYAHLGGETSSEKGSSKPLFNNSTSTDDEKPSASTPNTDEGDNNSQLPYPEQSSTTRPSESSSQKPSGDQSSTAPEQSEVPSDEPSSGGEESSEAPSGGEESSETPSDEPSGGEESSETPSDEPSGGEESSEIPSETPSDEPSEEPSSEEPPAEEVVVSEDVQ